MILNQVIYLSNYYFIIIIIIIIKCGFPLLHRKRTEEAESNRKNIYHIMHTDIYFLYFRIFLNVIDEVFIKVKFTCLSLQLHLIITAKSLTVPIVSADLFVLGTE